MGAPASRGRPNADTTLPGRGILITETIGSRVARLAAGGHVIVRQHGTTGVPMRAANDLLVRDGHLPPPPGIAS